MCLDWRLVAEDDGDYRIIELGKRHGNLWCIALESRFTIMASWGAVVERNSRMTTRARSRKNAVSRRLLTAQRMSSRHVIYCSIYPWTEYRCTPVSYLLPIIHAIIICRI